MSGSCTPTDRKDVSAIKATPVVESSPPAIESDMDLLTVRCPDCGGTNELRVLSVHCLQFHPNFKVVAARSRGLLEKKSVSDYEHETISKLLLFLYRSLLAINSLKRNSICVCVYVCI